MQLILFCIPGIIVFIILNKIFNIWYYGFKAILSTFVTCCFAGWFIMFLILGGDSDAESTKNDSANSTQEVVQSNVSNNSNTKNISNDTSKNASNLNTNTDQSNTNTDQNNTNSYQSNGNSNNINQSVTTYNSYYNDRFEYSIEYPSYLSYKSGSANGDGVGFADSSDKVDLWLGASNNSLNKTINDKYNEKIEEIKNDTNNYKITYNSLFDQAYAISWENSNIVYYQYLRLGKGSYNCFTISYPKNEEEKYNSIVEHLYNTFKSPDLEKYY